MDLAGLEGSIAGATYFLAIINFLDHVCPDQVEDGILQANYLWRTKHSLGFIQVELHELQMVPFWPIVLEDEVAMSEMLGLCDSMDNVTVPMGCRQH